MGNSSNTHLLAPKTRRNKNHHFVHEMAPITHSPSGVLAKHTHTYAYYFVRVHTLPLRVAFDAYLAGVFVVVVSSIIIITHNVHCAAADIK